MNSPNQPQNKKTPPKRPAEFLRVETWESPPVGPEVTRYPLVYGPPQVPEYNFARLPSPAAFGNMQLAFREKIEGLGYAQHFLLPFATMLIFWTTAACAVAAWILPFFPAVWTFGFINGIVAIGTLSYYYSSSGLQPETIGKTFLFPFCVTLALTVLSYLIGNRLFGTIVLGSATLILYAHFGDRPFLFYLDWISTEPRLKPETRRNLHLQLKSKPDIVLLLMIVATAAIVPMFSPTLAIVMVFAIAFAGIAIATRSPFRGISLTYWRWLYSFYPFFSYIAWPVPGVWRPAALQKFRRWQITAFIVSLYVTLACGLNLCVPSDLVLLTSPNWTEEEKFALRAEPHTWMKYVWSNLKNDRGHPEIVMLIPLTFAVQLALPIVVILAIFAKPLDELWQLGKRVAGHTDKNGNYVPGMDDDGRPEWQWYVDRLSSSSHVAKDPYGEPVREAEHLFIGMQPQFEHPILLDKAILAEHAYIVGETGSGKTSMGIMPLAIQLIRGHRINHDNPNDAPELSPVPPMVILDLKGDPALFHTIKSEVEARAKAEVEAQAKAKGEIARPEDIELAKKRAFRFFSPENKLESYTFNPFQNLRSENRSLSQLCNIFLDSLNLNHGEGYGRTYYSRKSRMLLYKALKSEPTPTNFKELYKALNEEATKDELRDAFELIATIHALEKYDVLGTSKETPSEDEMIHMPSLLEHGQVAYFWLPAALESISVREIGKLALFSLLTAAIDRQRSGKEPRQCYLFIDEFQRIAGENFKIILEQARSFRLAAILANQSMSDLRTHDTDLRPTVLTNTRLKMYFSISDPEDIKSFSQASGFELAEVRAYSGTVYTQQFSKIVDSQTVYTRIAQAPRQITQRSFSETMKNRITVNDVMTLNDSPTELILHVSRGRGYTQFGGMPIRVRTTWPTTYELYKARSDTPLPRKKEPPPEDVSEPVLIDRSIQQETADQMEQMEQFYQKHMAPRPEFKSPA